MMANDQGPEAPKQAQMTVFEWLIDGRLTNRDVCQVQWCLQAVSCYMSVLLYLTADSVLSFWSHLGWLPTFTKSKVSLFTDYLSVDCWIPEHFEMTLYLYPDLCTSSTLDRTGMGVHLPFFFNIFMALSWLWVISLITCIFLLLLLTWRANECRKNSWFSHFLATV